MAVSKAVTIEEVDGLPEAEWRRMFAILKDAFADNAPLIDPPSSLDQWSLGDIKRLTEKETLLVARLDGGIVGSAFLRVEADHLYLSRLAVAGQLRRAGIATALVRHAFTFAMAHELPSIRLQTRVELEGNHRAFESMGFAKVGEEAHAGYDRPTSIVMERRL